MKNKNKNYMQSVTRILISTLILFLTTGASTIFSMSQKQKIGDEKEINVWHREPQIDSETKECNKLKNFIEASEKKLAEQEVFVNKQKKDLEEKLREKKRLKQELSSKIKNREKLVKRTEQIKKFTVLLEKKIQSLGSGAKSLEKIMNNLETPKEELSQALEPIKSCIAKKNEPGKEEVIKKIIQEFEQDPSSVLGLIEGFLRHVNETEKNLNKKIAEKTNAAKQKEALQIKLENAKKEELIRQEKARLENERIENEKIAREKQVLEKIERDRIRKQKKNKNDKSKRKREKEIEELAFLEKTGNNTQNNDKKTKTIEEQSLPIIPNTAYNAPDAPEYAAGQNPNKQFDVMEEAMIESMGKTVTCFGSAGQMSTAELFKRHNEDLANQEFAQFYKEGDEEKDGLLLGLNQNSMCQAPYFNYSAPSKEEALFEVILTAKSNNEVNGKNLEKQDKRTILENVKKIVNEAIKESGDTVWQGINYQDLNGRTAYFWALSLGLFDVAKFLSENGAEKILYDDFGRSPIFVAYTEGNFNTIKELKNRNLFTELVKKAELIKKEKIDPFDINQKDSLGESPVFYCVKYGFFEAAKKLLNANSYDKKIPNAKFSLKKENAMQMTPIQSAYLSEKPDVAKAIMENSEKLGLGKCEENIFSKNSEGESVIFYAFSVDSPKITACIIQEVLYLLQADQKTLKKLPGSEALRKDLAELKEKINKLGTNDIEQIYMQETNKNGQTLAILASRNRCKEALMRLMKKFKTSKEWAKYANIIDNFGKSAVDYAIERLKLFENKIKINAKANSQEPFDYAVSAIKANAGRDISDCQEYIKTKDLVELLLNSGANAVKYKEHIQEV